jgi:SpoVK/Ycf46/Vps4 family AAA+-type ATPase
MFPAPIQSRISRRVHFGLPEFETQQKIFELHLKRAFAVQKRSDKINTKSLINNLTPTLCTGLVGRDIESICQSFALEGRQDKRTLLAQIDQFQKEKRAMNHFTEGPPQNPKEEVEATSKQPPAHKVW